MTLPVKTERWNLKNSWSMMADKKTTQKSLSSFDALLECSIPRMSRILSDRFHTCSCNAFPSAQEIDTRIQIPFQHRLSCLFNDPNRVKT